MASITLFGFSVDMGIGVQPCCCGGSSPCANCYDPAHPAAGNGPTPATVTVTVPANIFTGTGVNCSNADCAAFPGAAYVCDQQPGSPCNWFSATFPFCTGFFSGLVSLSVSVMLRGPTDPLAPNVWEVIFVQSAGGGGTSAVFRVPTTQIGSFEDCSSQTLTLAWVNGATCPADPPPGCCVDSTKTVTLSW